MVSRSPRLSIALVLCESLNVSWFTISWYQNFRLQNPNEIRIQIQIHNPYGKQSELKVFPSTRVRHLVYACRHKLGEGRYCIFHYGDMLFHDKQLYKRKIGDRGVIM